MGALQRYKSKHEQAMNKLLNKMKVSYTRSDKYNFDTKYAEKIEAYVKKEENLQKRLEVTDKNILRLTNPKDARFVYKTKDAHCLQFEGVLRWAVPKRLDEKKT